MKLRVATLGLVASLGSAHVARAQEAPLAVTLADAVRRGAERGPGVEVARAPGGEIDHARDAAAPLLRPPVATVAAGYRAGAITPGPEVTVSVMQDVPLRSLGGARREVADALHDVVVGDVARARLDGAMRAAIAWVGALEATEIATLRRDALAQAEAIAATTRKRVDAGAAHPYEKALAEADLGVARVALLDGEGAQTEAMSELRFALGAGPRQRVELRGDLYDAPAEPPPGPPVDAPHPAIELALARARAAAADARLASSALGPAIGIGAQYVREGTGDQVALGVLAIPLPLFDASRFDATRQRAIASAAVAEADLARASLARDAALADHDRGHWREVRAALREALAGTEEALRLAQAEYVAGARDVSLVLIARQRLAATRESMAHAAGEVRRADLRYARATGALARDTGRIP